LYIAGDRVDDGEFAALYLGDPSGSDAHGLGELGLSQTVALAFFGELVSALAGHQRPAAPLGGCVITVFAYQAKDQLPKIKPNTGGCDAVLSCSW
jgi:hypothetical protein